MRKNTETIEDLLEQSAGLRQAPSVNLESSDVNIIHSIARQVFKGTALTDRQFSLMREKLSKYKDQFVDIDFDTAVSTLRQPLRQIDRSKYIKIVSHVDTIGPNQIYESYKEKWKWIKVRFPFSKKLIISLQSIPHHHGEYYHEKGSHEHFFLLTEKNIFNVLNEFKEKNFEIDSEVLEYYNQVLSLNKDDYEICVKDNSLLNLHPNGLAQIENDLGKLSEETIILYKDRSLLYGITSFDNSAQLNIEQYDVLTKKLANRSNPSVHVSSQTWSIDQLFNSLRILERYPILILLDDKDPYSTLSNTYQSIRNYIDSSEVSVLHRLPSSESNGYNEFIQDNKLNNPLDKNTKVVYTSNNKVNKPLLQSNCNPITLLTIDNVRRLTPINSYANEFDLVIEYAEAANLIPYGRYRQTIETI